jgi:F-type H+-transporting ATPase subunit b
MQFLYNTDLVVAIGFVIFIGILLYFRVPGMIMSRLDSRAEQIRRDLEEARSLREEAQALLAQYERKQKEVKGQAEDIVKAARAEAEKAAEAGKAEIRRSVERRLRTATDQIEAAEAAAIREIRDRAAAVAVAAASEVIRARMSDADASSLVDASIAEVDSRLH